MKEILNKLWDIQKILTDEMPLNNTIDRKVLDLIDSIIDELEGD